MKKVFLTLILTILPLLASAEAVEIDGIWYNLVPKAKEAEVTNNPNGYSGRVEIPKSVMNDGIEYKVTSIGFQSFYKCSGLTSVTIPNSVTSIGSGAFSGCSGLTSITIPNSVTSIGGDAFSGCSGLTSVTIPNSVTSIEYGTFEGCSGLTSITIPNSVTSIGNEAFSDCSGLTSVTIPNSVTSIENGAFYKCGYTSIRVPSSVTNIGNYAFSAPNLATIIVEDGNTAYDSRNNCNAIIEKKSNTLIAGCKNTKIPNNVAKIGDSAFNLCSALTSITIPKSVTIIGWFAFYGCSSLTSVTIPNSLTHICDYAFDGCALTSVTIPNSVTYVGSHAFFCKNIISVTSENVDPYDIADDAFFKETYQSGTLYLPAGTKDLYSRYSGWRKFLNVEEIPAVIDGQPKCATPLISINNGLLKCTCATEGAQIKYEYATKGEIDNNGILTASNIMIIISATAIAEGYNPSKTATASFKLSDLISGDVNGDGKVDVADHVKLSDIIMNK